MKLCTDEEFFTYYSSMSRYTPIIIHRTTRGSCVHSRILIWETGRELYLQ